MQYLLCIIYCRPKANLGLNSVLPTCRGYNPEISPTTCLGIEFERKDRIWEAEALKYIPFKGNLDLFLLTHSATAHSDSAQMRSPRIPSHPATWDAASWKEPKELPLHLCLPLVNQEQRWGAGFTKTDMHFTASVVKILPKPHLKAFSLTQTYPVCRDHHNSGSHSQHPQQ